MKIAKAILISALAVAALLCGCSASKYEYTLREILYSEKNAQCSFLTDMEHAETKLADYFFDPLIEGSARNDCIEATDKILSQLDAGVSPEIYVFTEDRYSGINIQDHKLFLSVCDFQSAEYAADVLLAVYGPFTHYGSAYGYASVLCGDSTQSAEFSLPDVSDTCDLNLLCFDSAFASEEDIVKVKSIACDFARSYIAANGDAALRQLIADSDTSTGMEVVRRELSAYYELNGAKITPSLVRYGHGGMTFDYIVSSDLAVFYLERDWSDASAEQNPLIYDGFLHKSYADVKRFYEINLKQMEEYRELFALSDYSNDLSIVFSKNGSLSQYSFYQSGTHRLYVKNTDSLMHEYIHALTEPKASMTAWETEGFARYFSYRYDCYGIAFLNQDYNNASDSAATQYVREYMSTLDRPIDMAVDYKELENIAVWSRSYTDPNASYVAGSSFVQYLVELYGERAVIDSIYGSKEPLPKPYAELVRDWNTYIENKYQSYSKYEP